MRRAASTAYVPLIFPSIAQTNKSQTLPLLPHLLHTALLALLSASIPLSTTLTSVLIALPTSASAPLVSPIAKEILRADAIKSVHVFAFAGDRRMLLNESDGAFSVEEWEEASELAEEVCCKQEDEGGVSLGEGMDVDSGDEGGNLEKWLRGVVRRKVEGEQRWKSGT
jgi:exosome complex component RRP46